MQRDHHNTERLKRSNKIVLLCDGVDGPANQGALFRLADAFGVSHIYFGNAEIDLTSGRLRRTARGTELRVPHTPSSDLEDIIGELITSSFKVIALEITEKSKAISEVSVEPNQDIALIVGSEQYGIRESLLDMAHLQAHIDMYGQNSSMNVAQATGIALYALSI